MLQIARAGVTFLRSVAFQPSLLAKKKETEPLWQGQRLKSMHNYLTMLFLFWIVTFFYLLACVIGRFISNSSSYNSGFTGVVLGIAILSPLLVTMLLKLYAGCLRTDLSHVQNAAVELALTVL